MFELIVALALAPFALATLIWVAAVTFMVIRGMIVPIGYILLFAVTGALCYYAVLLAVDPEAAAVLYERWVMR